MPVNLTLSDDEARELIRVLFHAEPINELKIDVDGGLEGDAPFLAMNDHTSRQNAWDSVIQKFMSIASTVGMPHLVEKLEGRLRWCFKSDEAQAILDSREKDLERTLLVYLAWNLAQVHMDELGLELGNLGGGDPESNPHLGDALLLQMNLMDIYADYIKANGYSCLLYCDEKLKFPVENEIAAYKKGEGDYVPHGTIEGVE
jgi:hypothetical protein